MTFDNTLTQLSLDARTRHWPGRQGHGQEPLRPVFARFLTLKQDGRTESASACSRDGDTLTFSLRKSGVTAQVRATVKPRYFVFEWLSLSDPEVDEAVLGGLAVDLAKDLSASVAWASDGEFSAAVVPLNLQVEVGLTAGTNPVFAPRCTRQYGLTGSRIAVVGCPTSQVREVLQEIVQAEGLPWSPLGGPFAWDDTENRGSYLFAVVSEENVDEWIELGRRGGFAEIHLCPWWHRLGRYEPDPNLYPHGVAGLKQVTDKLHAAGFKVGMHTLTGCIQVDDPWVTPVPDKRLAKDARFTLARAITADDTVIETLERPAGLETFWSDMSTGNTLQIGDEIVAYTGLAEEPPFGFTGCVRGQWGTRRAAHDQGARSRAPGGVLLRLFSGREQHAD